MQACRVSKEIVSEVLLKIKDKRHDNSSWFIKEEIEPNIFICIYEFFRPYENGIRQIDKYSCYAFFISKGRQLSREYIEFRKGTKEYSILDSLLSLR